MPDGSAVVYAAGSAISGLSIAVRRLDQLQSARLTQGFGESPFMSPDGNWVGFFSNAKLQKVPCPGRLGDQYLRPRRKPPWGHVDGRRHDHLRPRQRDWSLASSGWRRKARSDHEVREGRVSHFSRGPARQQSRVVHDVGRQQRWRQHWRSRRCHPHHSGPRSERHQSQVREDRTHCLCGSRSSPRCRVRRGPRRGDVRASDPTRRRVDKTNRRLELRCS